MKLRSTILAVLLSAAAALGDIHKISRTVDISGGTDYQAITLYQFETVEHELTFKADNKVASLPPAANVRWRAWLASDPTNLYIEATGEVKNGPQGRVSIELAPNQTSFAVGEYISEVKVWDDSTSFIAKGSIDMRYGSPVAGVDYVGTQPAYPQRITDLLDVSITTNAVGEVLTIAADGTITNAVGSGRSVTAGININVATNGAAYTVSAGAALVTQTAGDLRYARIAAPNTFAAEQTFADGLTVSGGAIALNGDVTLGGDIYGSGLGLTHVDAYTLDGIDSTGFAQLGATNTFAAAATFEGVLTATSFVGDGSALTNIAPAEVLAALQDPGGDITIGGNLVGDDGTLVVGGSLEVEDDITASTYYGNGSNLTDVDADTLDGIDSTGFAQLGADTNTFTGGLVVNNDGSTTGDFRAESDNNANGILLDASADQIGIFAVPSEDYAVQLDGSGGSYGGMLVVYDSAATTLPSSINAFSIGNFNSTAGNYAKFSFVSESGTANISSASIGSKLTNHTSNYGTLEFWTRGATGGWGSRMVIDEDGAVGIATDAPARALHVNDVMRLEPRAAAPSSPGAGDIYFDSSTNKLRCYDGTSWQDCW